VTREAELNRPLPESIGDQGAGSCIHGVVSGVSRLVRSSTKFIQDRLAEFVKPADSRARSSNTKTSYGMVRVRGALRHAELIWGSVEDGPAADPGCALHEFRGGLKTKEKEK